MVENPPQVPRQEDPTTSEASKTRSSSSKRKSRHHHPVHDDDDDDDGGEVIIECSREHCSSCTANLVADCIAVCCCPCAIVNMLILAFVKVPWMMGRRCLRFVRKKGQTLEKNDGSRSRSRNRKSSSSSSSKENNNNNNKDVVIERGRSNNLRNERVVVVDYDHDHEFSSGFVVDDDDQPNFCARFEAEKVWLELYQLGHLGFFGRVSFSGCQGIIKGN